MLARAFYTLILLLLAPALLIGLYKKKTNKPSFGTRWKEHFGFTPKLKCTKRPIWIHAVSVGESILAISIIQKLKQLSPELPIVVTTTTSTGTEQIAKLGDLVEHRYMPIDFSFAVRRFLKIVQPKKLIIIETELWPNTLHQVAKQGIDISVINARLSEKSCRNYAKVQALFNSINHSVTRWLCQSDADAQRFVRLGVNPKSIDVTGSIKFDIQIDSSVEQQGKTLRERLGSQRPIWIAASTHKGEDEQVLKAHKDVLLQHPDALLILVPRHPERFDSVFELCCDQNLDTIRRTANQSVDSTTQIYLADTMGEMLTLLKASNVCFMGGSLIGKKVGGHNVLEPAALNIPTITGPSFFNFKEITDALIEQNGIWLCQDSNQLANQVNELFSSSAKSEQLAHNAYQLVEQNRGALSRTINLLQK
ncbi:lipid IV(A) 3-deoxy-D-manno-octulosonic acid transferase [Vibrio scophthalmi]|uniref:lipid IV(A) 3-deoxy-D-manno-octulosonic acid transferase n=1 Tax=Vibrio scophthalmi TaxID=45658 RepID=UPI0022852799|nr:lipid IV(A) 3-deoxy-D-manno-octulosonic acid transferase [Vibrio scophthalmi]MCY9804063.1 lipid IV(A) 3-deoxy-D-manno-octulosonic acid transferase [Vibrio scophthalmi]